MSRMPPSAPASRIASRSDSDRKSSVAARPRQAAKIVGRTPNLSSQLPPHDRVSPLTSVPIM